MKTILFILAISAPWLTHADDITTQVKYLHISTTECSGKTNFQGLIADGWGVIVAEVQFGTNSYSARPLPISFNDLKTLCDNYSNIQDYDLVIRNFGMFEGGIIVGVQTKEVSQKLK